MDREYIMADQQNDTIFREIQRWSLKFRCLLLVLCLLGAAGGVTSTVAILTKDSPQWALLFVTVVCGVLIPLGIGPLIWVNRLDTEVHRDGLYIRYFPFHTHFKRFKAEDLSEYHARKYRPILEYGGWGIRCGWKGLAYNVSGNEGVQLVFKNGKRLLIGSSKPCELEAAIRSAVHEN
jgi:hypothetical protein